MKEYKQEIFCSLEIEGIHRWEECPIEEVKYLRNDHRHIFGIKAFKDVSHSDRDIEFIELKHKIQKYLVKTYYNNEYQLYYLGKKSCEMLAIELIEEFNLSRCEVNEDNENGSIVYG